MKTEPFNQSWSTNRLQKLFPFNKTHQEREDDGGGGKETGDRRGWLHHSDEQLQIHAGLSQGTKRWRVGILQKLLKMGL
ncbi:unnamed protein product [Lactuca virosa]|uniref:Uncharacterized protein n=1 Tax=Lactuca virosa TaxID=75947 RepID=A0AAU9NKY6_9ASTR|nr:unnamed protein product [Lactuca virosa]